jgi:gentisate 1,2-dioxygenase
MTGPALTAERQTFSQAAADQNLAPLWEVLHRTMTAEPVTPARPVKWDYDRGIRPKLIEASGLISAAEAQRRVLVLKNPGFTTHIATTPALYAGVQLVMPGETAPAHRHSQAAMRFILEGSGGHTAVEGEPVPMYPGDFVATPSWTFHDHRNDTEGPMVWLDVLDVGLVQLLGAAFAEQANEEAQDRRVPPGDSTVRFANAVFPVDWKDGSAASPIYRYPYDRNRETLAAMARSGEPDACHGFKVRYVNPATGGHVMPTIGAFMQLLPAGFAGAPYRSTDAAIYTVVEGEGETRVGDEVIRWRPRDIFVVPSWARHTHRATSDAVLFSASDRPVHEALHLWREARP